MKVGAATEIKVEQYRVCLTSQGVRAHKLVTSEMLRSMGPGAVLVDVCVD